MKNSILKHIAILLIVSINVEAQTISEKLLGAAQKAVAGFTFSNEEAAALSKEAVVKMDKENPIASATDAYSVRLNKLFAKHKTENGLSLNYKVYKVKEVNAFATADGSVRVFSGLMDIMDDQELLAVIGHEIGHVANNDSRDAIKAAYRKEALLDAAASQSGKIASVTESQMGKIASGMIDAKHSRKQETDADLFAYDFMKKNGYNVNAVESAFTILANLNSQQNGAFEQMLSSHPDPKDRAALSRQKAEADGLYKPYIKLTKKAPAKKKKK